MKNAPVITLLTDFGLQDEYVGVMKGVILSINPMVHLIDICHNITRHRVAQAALAINAAFRYFPKGSIHVVVVDPGVGGKRKAICLQQEDHFFIAPDNGVLTMVIQNGAAKRICAITNQDYFLKRVSDTFHGRDIFGPVAAHLSKGVDMLRIGPAVALEDITRLEVLVPFVSAESELVGMVISIDHFGNLVTNISQAIFRGFKDNTRSKETVIIVGRSKIQGVSRSYDSVEIGSPVAIFGSRDLLEVSLNQGDARTYFKANVGQTIKVKPVIRKEIINSQKKAGFATTLPSDMFRTGLPRLSCTERAYPKRSAIAGRFVGMWKRSVFLYKTFAKWRMVMRIQCLNP